MDDLIILRSADNRRLAKVITKTADGYSVEGYEAGSRFEWEAVPVRGLDDIEEVLWHLAGDTSACIIRGAPRHPDRAGYVNRCQHQQEDGRQPDWDHARPGRQWVAFDIDKLAIGGRPEDLESLAVMARARLPEPFSQMACVWKLSSSTGLDDWQTVSMHLWFWMPEPVYDLSWRKWKEAYPVIDGALFKAVQPHYTADPVFVGCADPLRGARIGRLPGVELDALPGGLSGYSGWLEAHKAELAERKRELAEAQKRIVAGIGQSSTATRRYAVQALSGALSDLLSAPVGGRHAELVTKAFKMGGYVQDGFLGEAELLTALEQAIASVFPPKRHREEIRTAREMVRAGMAQPLDLSHIGRGRPKLSVVRDSEVEVADMPTEGNAAKKPAKKKEKVSTALIPWVDLGDAGEILPTANNLGALLSYMGFGVRRNLMDHETEWTGNPAGIARECLQGSMLSTILDEAVRHGWHLSEAAFWRGIGQIEAKNAYHPVADWARSKPWDGRSRFGDLFATLTIDPQRDGYRDLMRVQLERWLVAGGHCLAMPGHRSEGMAVQGVLVLQGPQDIGKTRWFRSLVSDPAWFAEGVTLDPSTTDSVIAATSAFLVELGELDATTRKADVAALKSFLTKACDKYRTPYGRKADTYPRRTIYGGTVNPAGFLVDDTGNRRFWMMPVVSIRSDHGIDMQQVWAEAVARAEAGEDYWMPDEHKAAQLELAGAFQKQNESTDDFFLHWRLPKEGEVAPGVPLPEVRAAMRQGREWSLPEKNAFPGWLRSIGVEMSVSKGVKTAKLIRIEQSRPFANDWRGGV